VVRDEPLRVVVVLVDADVRVAEVEDRERLTVPRPDLDHEHALRREVRRRIREHRDLAVLRHDVVDRVEDDVGERELAVDARVRHVADRDRDRVGLLPQLRDHVGGEVDSRDPNAASRERDGDPAGADRELERAA